MQRCIELAKLGAGYVSPNPMVGCMVVHNGEIIGEGYHQKFGEAHAEVNAINSVKDEALLKEATVYVTLEPCSHYGKTPPCADMLVGHKVKQVVVGSLDPHDKVAGKGIKKLMDAGIDVVVGVLEDECNELNKRFFKAHKQQLPYVILKWAETKEGFIAPINGKEKISGDASHQLVHKWRAEEDAIMVGTNTAEIDNPKLDLRLWKGKNPVRVVVDRALRLPGDLHLFDGSIPTIVFTEQEVKAKSNLEFVTTPFDNQLLPSILKELHDRNIMSVIVEGGTQLLTSFISQGLWDEARVFVSNKKLDEGVKGPVHPDGKISTQQIEEDQLIIITK